MSEICVRGDDKELTAAVAAWWAERFSQREPAVPTGVAVVDTAAALTPADRPTPQQVEAFRASLERTISADLKSTGSSYIRMDYDPDRALGDALQAAGISTQHAVTYLPWKVTTFINAGEFTTIGWARHT